MNPPDPRRAILARLLPDRCALAVWDPGDDRVPPLMPGEEDAVVRAVVSRRVEFARGRACARRAMAALGVDAPGPILVGPHREPLWPRDLVGSISHCAGLVAAVAAWRTDLPGLGLDVERDAPLPEGVAPQVLHPTERTGARAAELPEVAVFSVKEAIHKALFPATGVWLDFLDVEVRLAAGGPGAFAVDPAPGSRSGTPRLADVRGKVAVGEGYVFSVAWLTA